MTPFSVKEQEWDAHGLRCHVVRTRFGHRCGYVAVPEGHPWHGKGYDDPVATTGPDLDGLTVESAFENLGVITAFVAGSSEGGIDRLAATPAGQVLVHGGVTYAGPAKDGGWEFGFDCAHLDDTPERWTLEAVVAETERMAEQIASLKVAA